MTDFDITNYAITKIFIMTDADVGWIAHPGTLLLLFFRQYAELINRGGGNVFVAQTSALTAFKKGGRGESYIKDDKEYQREIMRAPPRRIWRW